MVLPEIFSKLLISLAIGALVGIEREMRGRGELVEGIRTFILISLLGTLSGYFSETVIGNQYLIFIGFILVGILTIYGYRAKVLKTKHLGLTTEIAVLLTFVIGLLIYYDQYPYFLSVSMGIILTFILVSKEILHRFAKHLKIEEIWDALVFAILAFIILPILPNRTIDPFNSVNPFLIWFAIVIVLSMNFLSYIAVKIFGVSRGITLTGLFGGMASSTAVSIDMAGKARQNKKIIYPAAFAVVVASTTMFLRMIILAGIFNPSQAVLLALPFVVLALAGYLLSINIWRKMEERKAFLELKSPLALGPAFKYGIFFSVIFLVSGFVRIYFGESGLILVALIAGLVDVDAITISYSTMALTTLSPLIATIGIVLAGLSNTFSKWFLVSWLGNKKLGLEVGKPFSVIIAIGIIILALLVRI